jgi:hypothetical protein
VDFIKYIKIKALGHKDNELIFANGDDEIVLEEKIDGANFRFMIKDGEFIFGSRTQVLDETRQDEKNWKACCDYIRATVKPLKKYEGFIFYGELCRRHTIGYNFDTMPPFIGFDVLRIKTHIFMNWSMVQSMFARMGLQFVPVVKTVLAGSIAGFEDEDVPLSKYYDGRAEGVVFKNYKRQIFGKHVRTEFKEDNKKAFGGTPKYEETDSGKIMARFCTNARIEKCVYKLEDEGYCIQMEMMKVLPRMVYEDIVEEEWRTILLSHYKVDCGKMKRICCKRCAAVLKQMMGNKVFGVKE